MGHHAVYSRPTTVVSPPFKSHTVPIAHALSQRHILSLMLLPFSPLSQVLEEDYRTKSKHGYITLEDILLPTEHVLSNRSQPPSTPRACQGCRTLKCHYRCPYPMCRSWNRAVVCVFVCVCLCVCVRVWACVCVYTHTNSVVVPSQGRQKTAVVGTIIVCTSGSEIPSSCCQSAMHLYVGGPPWRHAAALHL